MTFDKGEGSDDISKQEVRQEVSKLGKTENGKIGYCRFLKSGFLGPIEVCATRGGQY